MRSFTRFLAITQLALLFPAALFLTAVLTSAGTAPQYDLAHVARGIVSWYSGQIWTLWLLLLALPCAVLVAGCATLLRSRHSLAIIPAPLATLFVAGMTLISAGVLGVVMLHMLAN